jgi:hypothetical protein
MIGIINIQHKVQERIIGESYTDRLFRRLRLNERIALLTGQSLPSLALGL